MISQTVINSIFLISNFKLIIFFYYFYSKILNMFEKCLYIIFYFQILLEEKIGENVRVNLKIGNNVLVSY